MRGSIAAFAGLEPLTTQEDPGTEKWGWGDIQGMEKGRGQSACFRGENPFLKLGTEERKRPPVVTSPNQSEGSSLPQPPPCHQKQVGDART